MVQATENTHPGGLAGMVAPADGPTLHMYELANPTTNGVRNKPTSPSDIFNFFADESPDDSSIFWFWQK